VVLIDRAIENGPLGLLALDRHGRVADANRAACELLGHPGYSLIGRRLLDFIHPEERGSISSTLESLLSGDSARFRQDLRFIDSAGVEVRVELNLRAAENASGGPVRAVGTVDEAAEIRELPATTSAAENIRRLVPMRRTPQPAARVDVGAVLQAVAELPGATRPRTATALSVPEAAVALAWSNALARRLLKRSRYDRASQEWVYELTPIGRAHIRAMARRNRGHLAAS
jgi:PAS domain S-box-containing protein